MADCPLFMGSDTCAYLFGVAFGKHKMAPVLSPKKSVEGAVGGVFGAAVLGLFTQAFLEMTLLVLLTQESCTLWSVQQEALLQ